MSWPDRVARMWEGNHLFSVLLELTHRCDQACHICYNPRPRDDGLLKLAHYEQLLRDLAGMGTLSLALSGGEPLLHPDFMAVGRAARELGFAVRIKTNGLCLDAVLAGQIRREVNPFGVDVSLHGACAATHDLQTRLPGSFDRVVGNIRAMVTGGLRVRLRLPFTRWNEGELQEGLALADSLGVPVDIDPELSPRDNGDAGPLALAASEEGLACLAAALRPREDVDLARVRAGASGNQQPRMPRRHCAAGCATLAIDPYGEVFPCVQWRRSAGSLHQAPIQQIWETSPVLAEVRRVLEKVMEETASRPPGSVLAYCPGLADTMGEDPTQAPSTPGPRARFLQMLAEPKPGPRSTGS
ncbi:MAG TPA: radical SAM protein [Thermoanaerobaculaceae bacterium]|nr:radical SAM protein [Thermoanaerobaculaceae bacterium]HPS76823.1 radical SAM protein [Thermoanaerobaculaceae bacterium]